jgi:hypothetical protein
MAAWLPACGVPCGAALLAVVAALHGCSGSPPDDRPATEAQVPAPAESPDPRTTAPDSAAAVHVMPDSVTLTATQPRARLAVDAAAVAGGDVLVFTVSDVRNPDGRSIDVEALLRPAGEETSVPIGRIALFPVDRGGTFTLRVPPAAAAVVERARAEGAALQLELALAGDAGTGEDRRALVVHGIHWRRAGDR